MASHVFLGGKGPLHVTTQREHSGFGGARTPRPHAYRDADKLETGYTLCKRGRIIGISGDWDRFAWANDGLEATADCVMGRHLSDYLDGFETISFINALVFSCRRLDIRFQMISRCDSATDMNLMRMTIKPDKNETLEISHSLILSRPLREHPLSYGDAPHVTAVRCSMCCSYAVGRHWIDPLSQTDTVFTTSRHTICPDCKERASDALRRAQTSSPPKLTLVTP